MLTWAAALLLVTIAVLAIPVTVQFHVSRHQVLEQDVRLYWAFGLVSVPIPLAKSNSKPAPRKKTEPRIDRSIASKRKKRDVVGALRQRRFRRRILRFVGDLWHAIQKRDLRLGLRIGLGDPAETGRLWAVVGPIAGMLAAVREMSISIEPEFYDATFELDTSGSLRLIPVQVIYLTLALVLSPAFWQGMRRLCTAER